MTRTHIKSGTALLSLGLCLPLQAALTISGLTADNTIDSGSGLRNSTSTDEIVRIGSGSARALVYVFQLPTLGPGETFTGSTLSFTLLENGTNSIPGSGFSGGVEPTFNVDLYGLDRRAASGVLLADGHFGTTQDTSATVTLLQDNFLTSSTGVGEVVFSGAALGDYLTAQYDGGAGAGQHVFLRFSPDGETGSDGTNSQRYRFAMAGNDNHAGPQITYVPEPASAFLAAFGGIFLLRRSRR